MNNTDDTEVYEPDIVLPLTPVRSGAITTPLLSDILHQGQAITRDEQRLLTETRRHLQVIEAEKLKGLYAQQVIKEIRAAGYQQFKEGSGAVLRSMQTEMVNTAHFKACAQFAEQTIAKMALDLDTVSDAATSEVISMAKRSLDLPPELPPPPRKRSLVEVIFGENK